MQYEPEIFTTRGDVIELTELPPDWTPEKTAAYNELVAAAKDLAAAEAQATELSEQIKQHVRKLHAARARLPKPDPIRDARAWIESQKGVT